MIPHTPEQIRQASNLAHRLAGAVLGVAAILALNEAFLGGARGLRLAWSGTMTVLGGLFMVVLIFHHGLRHLPAWLADLTGDPHQRQHLLMGLLLTAGGIVEFAHAQRWTTALIWHYPWPLALILIGVMFARHAQHGRPESVTRAVRFHRTLGGTLILAGLLAGIQGYRYIIVLAYLWPLILLLAAGQLIVYREPEGAWEPDDAPSPHTR